MKNFTVIGNILFVHFYDPNGHKSKEPVIEIPPAIFDRMLSYSNYACSSVWGIGSDAGITPITVVNVGGKNYIAFVGDRSAIETRRYYYSTYHLKDI